MTAPGSNSGPVVFQPPKGTVGNGTPLLPNGTPNFGAIPTGTSSGSVPVDSTGSIDVWNLPAWILDYEKSVKKPFVWSTKPATATNGNKAFENPAFKAANGLPEKPSDENLNVNMSAEEIMKQYAGMSQSDPMGFAALQKELQAGGWYDSASSIYGGWNQQTETALASAMVQYLKVSHAAGVPVTFTQFLQNASASNQGINGNTPGGSGGGSSLPSRPTLTDPDTLMMYAQKAAQAALGRNLSSAELSKFVDQFHSEQTNAYSDALHGNGAVVDKNDPRASAIQYVTKGHQQEFDQHQVTGYADAFLNMFLPNSSAAPNVNVDPSAVGY